MSLRTSELDTDVFSSILSEATHADCSDSRSSTLFFDSRLHTLTNTIFRLSASPCSGGTEEPRKILVDDKSNARPR